MPLIKTFDIMGASCCTETKYHAEVEYTLNGSEYTSMLGSFRGLGEFANDLNIDSITEKELMATS